MPYLILKHDDIPFAIVPDGTLADIDAHINNGYREYLQYLIDGHISGEVVQDASGVTLVRPPPTENQVQDRFLRILLTDRFELENRIRVLEGKAEITRAQFIAALKTKLGM